MPTRVRLARLALESEINVTPMIDVLLVLLGAQPLALNGG